jgi:hypothetical protein
MNQLEVEIENLKRQLAEANNEIKFLKTQQVGLVKEDEPKKTNKNGYLVMASEGEYEYYVNEPYGYSDTEKGAQIIANEAVCFGSKRDNKGLHCNYVYFNEATIIDLDTMKKVGEPDVIKEELEYCRSTVHPPDGKAVFDSDGNWTDYICFGRNKEKQEKYIKELYDKMIEAKKAERRK